MRTRAQIPQDAKPDSEFRIVIRTDFLKNIEIDSEHLQQTTAMLARFSAPTFAWIYPLQSYLNKFGASSGSPSLWFSSTGYFSPDNIGWLPDLLANTAIVQPINAQIHAYTAPKMLGSGTPDVSRPAELRDAGLDEILDVVAEVYAPLGQGPSRWAGTTEFEQFAEKWGKTDYCFGFGDPSQMTLETPFGNDSALIQFLTEVRHPQLGHGLLVTRQLPYADTPSAIARSAAELNLLEAVTWTSFPQFGCWQANETRAGQVGLAFALFIPNALHRPGLATEIAFWFLRRARWARSKNSRTCAMLQ